MSVDSAFDGGDLVSTWKLVKKWRIANGKGVRTGIFLVKELLEVTANEEKFALAA